MRPSHTVSRDRLSPSRPRSESPHSARPGLRYVPLSHLKIISLLFQEEQRSLISRVQSTRRATFRGCSEKDAVFKSSLRSSQANEEGNRDAVICCDSWRTERGTRQALETAHWFTFRCPTKPMTTQNLNCLLSSALCIYFSLFLKNGVEDREALMP